MKKILVLGAGLVARPLIQYLLNQAHYTVQVASRTVSKAKALVGDAINGVAAALDVSDAAALEKAVSQSDLVVSLLPYTYHLTVARHCLTHRKHLVTTSYVSPAMRELDAAARKADVVFLNEIGLDPGIDHMSAMKTIHAVQRKGGEITSFISYCGGLPAPEANTNPFGYKFSWSPRGVLLAGKNPALYLWQGKQVEIPGGELFDKYTVQTVEGLGTFEAYPNRNSLGYIDLYGIKSTKTMLRGTLRNAGWCPTLKKMIDFGWLDEQSLAGLSGKRYSDLSFALAAGKAASSPLSSASSAEARKAAAGRLRIAESSDIIGRMEWLGLFSEDPLPLEAGSPLDVIEKRMLDKLQYRDRERDMIVLRHEFGASYPGGQEERIVSLLVDYGIPGKDSAMARTVGIPAAIGVKMVLEGKLRDRGVVIPVAPSVYEPVLAELASDFAIGFSEHVYRKPTD